MWDLASELSELKSKSVTQELCNFVLTQLGLGQPRLLYRLSGLNNRHLFLTTLEAVEVQNLDARQFGAGGTGLADGCLLDVTSRCRERMDSGLFLFL